MGLEAETMTDLEQYQRARRYNNVDLMYAIEDRHELVGYSPDTVERILRYHEMGEPLPEADDRVARENAQGLAV